MPHIDLQAEPYFYCRHIPSVGETLILAGEEARHMVASRRLKTGSQLYLFDGAGEVAHSELLDVRQRGKTVAVKILHSEFITPPKATITLACALPKGERQRALLDMATQLGMSVFIPLVCARSIPKINANSMRRWQKICLEACKQSRRAYIPVIQSAADIDAVLTLAAKQSATVILADPAGKRLSELDPHPEDTNCYLFVGPEGGFTDDERQKFSDAQALPVKLDTGILRIETAAVALLAQIKSYK